MSLSPRGQTSFEMILVAAAVIAITVGILSIVAKENAITTGLAIVKAQSISKLNEAQRSYLIEKIDYKDSGATICFNVITSPRPVTETVSFADTVTDVMVATGYQGATIRLNVPC